MSKVSKILQLMKEIWSGHEKYIILLYEINKRGIIISELKVGLRFFFSSYHVLYLHKVSGSYLTILHIVFVWRTFEQKFHAKSFSR